MVETLFYRSIDLQEYTILLYYIRQTLVVVGFVETYRSESYINS